MEKQEVINEEYSKIGEVIVSDNKDGWKLLELVPKDKLHLFDIKGQIARPKSLQGIENNNGWIKIEDFNLSKPTICHVINNLGEVDIDTYRNDIENFFKSQYTHYQPIQKPLKPLY